MKYKIILDKNNYITGIVHTGTNEDSIELNISELYMDKLDCYKLVNNQIIFDENKAQDKDNKELLIKEKSDLEAWLSAHDYIGTKISTGRATLEEYADEIALMTEKAERINEINRLLEAD